MPSGKVIHLFKKEKMKVSLTYQAEFILGESPVWDYRSGELLWVDIENKTLNFYKTDTKKYEVFRFDNHPGCVVPIIGGHYLLGLQKGLAVFNRDKGSLSYVSDPEKELKQNRFNDGKCDPRGRFWVGSMHLKAKEGRGTLYCLDNSMNVFSKIRGLSVPNGMAWSADNKKMFFIDSQTRKVFQFDYCDETSEISNQMIAIDVPEKHGLPDGMCIDHEGMLWIAHWGGGNVSRWNPENGKLLRKISIPSPHVTSCCFGNTHLDTLYITTARKGLSAEEIHAYPLSGSVFSIKPEVRGLKTSYYKINSY